MLMEYVFIIGKIKYDLELSKKTGIGAWKIVESSKKEIILLALDVNIVVNKLFVLKIVLILIFVWKQFLCMIIHLHHKIELLLIMVMKLVVMVDF